jgi:hypothetical protein
VAAVRRIAVAVALATSVAIPAVAEAREYLTSVASALKPKLGVSVVVVPIAGEVRIEPKGARRFVVLRRARRIPVGSTVDATRGRVRLITASNARGSTQSGVFDGAPSWSPRSGRPRA